jgi:hypothetical protein
VQVGTADEKWSARLRISAVEDFPTSLYCESIAAAKAVQSERSPIHFSLLIDGALS